MKTKRGSWVAAVVVTLALSSRPASSFGPHHNHCCPSAGVRSVSPCHHADSRHVYVTGRSTTRNNNILHGALGSDDDQEFSTEVRLRVEADSPFLKIRQAAGYTVLIAGASISLVVSTTRILAALSGINTDLMQESLTNAAIDLGGIALLGYLLKRDLDATQSKLKRASRGAQLAALTVRGGNGLLPEGVPSTPTVSLGALRRGRGIEKRVVIAVAGEERTGRVIEEATRLEESLYLNDLLVVPVVVPGFSAPRDVDVDDIDSSRSIALPVGGNWRGVIDDETAEAREQGVDVEQEGVCIVLKKNGRVGTRTRGIALGRMVGEVTERREAGMDVANI
eukprot:CAMPEP_0178712686 /NCGR_PEP_ID=MMETSP0699-20121125/19019_1 /TAXON_ID=265572 /ORGANISM="Extubocellulus spinifer, Strain CCMP396" /LENGTH=336 /DNA_ID=CAMNT_0020361463 /DNA_START=45 /DNA_END=1056 /DNA_ORIENTATION=-